MQPSPNLVSPQPPVAAPDPLPPRHDRWLNRVSLILWVMLLLWMGLLLVFLPWTPLWTFNRFFLFYAPVARVAASGAVRGLASGLGLLNLWIAISDAIHYKES